MSLLDFIEGAHVKILRPQGGCHTCPRKRVHFVPATLNKGKVLFLGEVPGETDVAEGELFTGASGSMLKQVARECNVPEPWSFSSTVHCKPEADKPKPKEVQCCLSQYILEEIQSYEIIVLVGNVPLQAFFPGAKADHFRGNVALHPDFPGQKFYAISSPSWVLRNPARKGEFQQQMQRLARIAQGEPKPDWKIVRGKEAVAVLRDMLTRPILSLDLETSRLESWVSGGRIKSLACTSDGKTVVVASEKELHFKQMLDMIGDYLEMPENSVIGAHIGFDLVWFEEELGITVQCQLIHDVAVQWYHAGQYRQASLKELVARELDGYRHLIHMPHEMKDEELLLDYNAEDVVYPIQLMKKALAKVKPQTRDLCARVLGPAELILQRITATGIYVRQDYRQQKIDEYAERRRAVIEKWKAEDPEFIPHEHESGDGLLHYLFNMRKLPVIALTESKQASTDKSVLKQYVRDGYTFCQNLLDVREIDKIESTYLTAYDKHLWPDSRVRSSYPLTWTDTGRSSSRSPNLQNIPRKKEIRDLFGVAPGHVLLESDLSQIEFRIMVCLARDANGIAGYMRSEDAHTITARKIVASRQGIIDPAVIASIKPTKEERTLSKPVNFGFLYGAQARMVQVYAMDEYGVMWTIEEAENFRTIFFQTYPALPQFHADAAQKLINNKGWFESVVGHVFHYGDWDHPDDGKRDHVRRSALNSEAQGPAAQIAFYIMVLARRLLDQRGFQDVQFVNTVHDSILTEIPNPAWVPDIVATINEACQMAYEWVKHWFVVPLIMEHKYGESWGTMTDIK